MTKQMKSLATVVKQWFFNFDVKYVQVDTTLTVTGGAVPGATAVTLDPWVIGIGVGTRF